MKKFRVKADYTIGERVFEERLFNMPANKKPDAKEFQKWFQKRFPPLKIQKVKIVVLSLLICIMLSSCATVFGGKVSECQRTKPQPGNPARPVRVVPFVADILLFWPGILVDFATGAIYKPCPGTATAK